MGEVWKRKGFKPDNIRPKYWVTSELSVSLTQQAGWRCSGVKRGLELLSCRILGVDGYPPTELSARYSRCIRSAPQWGRGQS